MDKASQNQGEQAQNPPDVKTFTNKNKLILLGMIIVSVIFFIPLIMFVFSSLRPAPVPPKDNEEVPRSVIAPEAPFVPDELIVELKSKYTEPELKLLKQKFDEYGVVSQEKAFDTNDPKTQNFYLLKFKKGTDVKKVAEELTSLDLLNNIEANYIVETQVIPNDSFFNQQWGMDKLGLPQVWDTIKGTNSIRVAVVDTGIDYNHQDFRGRNIIKGQDFSTCEDENCTIAKVRGNDPIDKYGHGTHVAGIIGAVTNNSLGVAGVNWEVTLLAVKTMNARSGSLQDVIDGIYYAADNGSDVINLSLGTQASCSQTPSYRNAIDYALSRGIIVIVAAGNEGANTKNVSPASCPGVITVAATNPSDAKASFSNWGAEVAVSAPGTDIMSTWINNTYKSTSGTSMAAPYVSGVTALLLSANRSLTRDQIRSCLINGGDPTSSGSQYIGPRVNAVKAISLCLNISPTTALTPTVTVTPTVGITPGVTVSPTPINTASSSILTKVIVDTNGNGTSDATDQGYQGAQVSLGGQATSTGVTDAQGSFLFKNLLAGQYSITVTISGISIPPRTLSLEQNQQATYTLILPVQVLTPVPSGTIPQITVAPSITSSPPNPTSTTKPTPTPQKTYSCRESGTNNTARGAIQIGNLVCTPN